VAILVSAMTSFRIFSWHKEKNR